MADAACRDMGTETLIGAGDLRDALEVCPALRGGGVSRTRSPMRAHVRQNPGGCRSNDARPITGDPVQAQFAHELPEALGLLAEGHRLPRPMWIAKSTPV